MFGGFGSTEQIPGVIQPVDKVYVLFLHFTDVRMDRQSCIADNTGNLSQYLCRPGYGLMRSSFFFKRSLPVISLLPQLFNFLFQRDRGILCCMLGECNIIAILRENQGNTSADSTAASCYKQCLLHDLLLTACPGTRLCHPLRRNNFTDCTKRNIHSKHPTEPDLSNVTILYHSVIINV